MTTTQARRDSLWTLIVAPTVWAAHFLVCYVVAAVHCAKAGSHEAGLGSVPLVIAVATLVALVLIVASGFKAFRQWGFGTHEPPHDQNTVHDRRLFLGFATLLLCGLSFVATLFVALPAAIITDCR